MTLSIQSKTVLITGANRGIGKVLVDTFLRHGAARVYAGVRDLGKAEALVSSHGDRLVPIRIDLADATSIQAAAAQASDVEVVVNNGGAFLGASPLDGNAIESLELLMEVNVKGLILMAQAFAPVLARNGGGAFVQLNSVASMKTFAHFASYSASKAAAYAITQALRDLLQEQGTAVVSVHPGPIATDMGEAAGLTAIAEPPSLVAEAILKALETGEFHVFPDTMARQIGGHYGDFARNVVEAEMGEA